MRPLTVSRLATSLALALLLLAPSAATAQTQAAVETPTITAEELLSRLGAGETLFILDVRTPQEFAAGHVPGAVNIDHKEIEARIEEVRRAGDLEVVVYCRSGRRARIAEKILFDNGLERLLHLEGDMLGWLEKGLPIEKEDPQS